MLDFDIEFFKEETRDGFTIPAFMKHAWAAQLEMLSMVDRICEENDIPYFADWGTLLGTIRHKGYIPWDDDIDLCMLRKDLERFAEVVDSYEGIIINTCYNAPDHGLHAARVMNSTKFTTDRNIYKDYHGFPFPVGLDIFSLDYVPREKKLEKEQVDALRLCSQAFYAKEWLDEHTPIDKEYAEKFAEYKSSLKRLEKICNIEFSEENPSQQEILILNEEIEGLYNSEEADYLTEMPCLGNGKDYYIPKESYYSSTRMPFENTTIPVPLNYDLILRKKYGDDYMTPKNIACGHDYPFYDKYINAIFDEKIHKTFEGAFEYIQDISSRFYIKFIEKDSTPTLRIDEKFFDDLSSGEDNSRRKFAAQCEVLEELKRICSISNISYYAIDDTLDAIVSGDDDGVINSEIHVAIKRENFREFLSMLDQKLDPWFNYSSIYSKDDYESMTISISSDKYRCDYEEYKKRFHGYNEEVLVYIDVIDLVSTDSSKDEVRKTLVENLITTSKSMPSLPPYSDEIVEIVEEWKKIIDISIDMESNLRNEFLQAADSIAGSVRDEDVTKVRISANLQEGIDTVYDRRDFDDAVEVPFCVTTISVPSNYKERKLHD